MDTTPGGKLNFNFLSSLFHPLYFLTDSEIHFIHKRPWMGLHNKRNNDWFFSSRNRLFSVVNLGDLNAASSLIHHIAPRNSQEVNPQGERLVYVTTSSLSFLL